GGSCQRTPGRGYCLLLPPPNVRQPFCQRLRARALPETEQRRQHLSQVGEGVDPQVLASPHHAVQRCRCPASLRTATELPVAAAHHDLAQRSLRQVIVYGEIPLLGVPHQRLPVRQRVADRLPQVRLRQRPPPPPHQPAVEPL